MIHLTLALPELQRQLDPLPPWRGPFQEVCRRLTKHFGRIETKQLALDYLQGLLSPVERKNGWQLAEHLGQVNPYRLQHLLDRAVWDADDRHVLAAAIAAEVPVIVTFNLSDFPDTTLSPYGIRALHPDVFLLELLEATPEAFIMAIRTHRIALKNPPRTPEDYLLLQ